MKKILNYFGVLFLIMLLAACENKIGDKIDEIETVDSLTIYSGSNSMGYQYSYIDNVLTYTSWDGGDSYEKQLENAYSNQEELIKILSKYEYGTETENTCKDKEECHDTFITITCNGDESIIYVEPFSEAGAELEEYFEQTFRDNKEIVIETNNE